MKQREQEGRQEEFKTFKETIVITARETCVVKKTDSKGKI